MANNRNKKCMCGSGKKFKNCCLDKIPELKKKYIEAVTIDKKSLRERILAWNLDARQSAKSFFRKLWAWLMGLKKNQKRR